MTRLVTVLHNHTYKAHLPTESPTAPFHRRQLSMKVSSWSCCARLLALPHNYLRGFIPLVKPYPRSHSYNITPESYCKGLLLPAANTCYIRRFAIIRSEPARCRAVHKPVVVIFTQHVVAPEAHAGGKLWHYATVGRYVECLRVLV